MPSKLEIAADLLRGVWILAYFIVWSVVTIRMLSAYRQLMGYLQRSHKARWRSLWWGPGLPNWIRIWRYLYGNQDSGDRHVVALREAHRRASRTLIILLVAGLPASVVVLGFLSLLK
jgi:hypothetical protein